MEKVRAIFDSSMKRKNGKEARIPLVNNVIINKKGGDQLPYDASDKTKALTAQGLMKAQKQENPIKRPFEIKKNDTKVDKSDKQKEEREVKVMLKDMEKYEIDENDSMYRRTVDDRKQLLLPKKLTALVH